jgi:hypothetical protein
MQLKYLAAQRGTKPIEIISLIGFLQQFFLQELYALCRLAGLPL